MIKVTNGQPSEQIHSDYPNWSNIQFDSEGLPRTDLDNGFVRTVRPLAISNRDIRVQFH